MLRARRGLPRTAGSAGAAVRTPGLRLPGQDCGPPDIVAGGERDNPGLSNERDLGSRQTHAIQRAGPMRHSAPSSSRLRRQQRAATGRPAAAPASEQASQDPAAGQAPGADETGGPPASRRSPAPARLWHQLPYLIVLCCLVLSLLWMRRSDQHVRGGTLAVAGLLFAAALVRLTLPERVAGMLASRRRLTDVAVMTALGTGLLVAGLLLPVQP
jgi:hypothetical protein